ncbi:MAG: winged helix-turn-helix domain-containing protein [Oscillospiraceae bacterium]|nr:winged helix-turn-helix domain-containing protein [Oscillospiraceae bacterium]
MREDNNTEYKREYTADIKYEQIREMIKLTDGAFSLTLPNVNHARPLRAVHRPKPQHRMILEYLRDNAFVTNEIVQEVLSVKQTRAYRIIREMVDDGLIVKPGAGKEDKKYVLAARP